MPTDGGSPDFVGRTFNLSGVQTTLVRIMPARLLTESFLLAAPGSAVGVLVTYGTLSGFLRWSLSR